MDIIKELEDLMEGLVEHADDTIFVTPFTTAVEYIEDLINRVKANNRGQLHLNIASACNPSECQDVRNLRQLLDETHKQLIVVCQNCAKIQKCGNAERRFLCECGYYNTESDFTVFNPDKFLEEMR